LYNILKGRKMKMSKKIIKNKFLVATGLCLMLILSYADAFAWGGHGGGRRYHYREGRWYGRGWFGLEVAVSALTIGAVVESLPYGYRTVVVAGQPYYYCDGYYYRYYPYGYVVVPPPVVTPVYTSVPVVAPAPVVIPVQSSGQDKIITINIPNKNGTYTPVSLIKYSNGYLGPQGEYYEGHPNVDQLRALYGD